MKNHKIQGKVTIAPTKPVIAGQSGTWTITYTVGSEGIAEGGCLRISPPIGINHLRNSLVRWDMGRVTASCSGKGSLSIIEHYTHPQLYHTGENPYVEIFIRNGALKEGDKIEIKFGDISEYHYPAYVQTFAMKDAPFLVEVDTKGDGQFNLVDDKLSLDILSAEAIRLMVAITSTPEIGSEFKIIVKAEDQFGNPATGYRGTTEFIDFTGEILGGKNYAFKEQDQGAHTFLAICKEDFSGTISIIDKENGIAGTSNPFSTNFIDGDYKIFFGEIHSHTSYSDGLGTPETSYRYARDYVGLDFSAVTDHHDGGIMISGEHWIDTQEKARKFNEPGRFVTFLGYEWATHFHGHKCVYFLDGDMPCIAPDNIRKDTPDFLWRKLYELKKKGHQSLVIPHHTNADCEIAGGYKHTDWSFHNPEFEKLAEIYQMRGSFESDIPDGFIMMGENRSSVQDILNSGSKVGFTGGTDNHRGHPGCGRHPLAGLLNEKGRVGVVAVYAKELTREAIWDALVNRRTYATAGSWQPNRILMYFSINDHIMGEEFKASTSELVCRAKILSAIPIEKVEIVKNGKVVYAEELNIRSIGLKWIDNKSTKNTDYYYLRIKQNHWNRAWSSPLWIS